MAPPERHGPILGGIGTMLSQVDTCPNCGQDHSENPYAFAQSTSRGCSRSVMGALPFLMHLSESSAFAAPEEVVLTASPAVGGARPSKRRYSARDPPLAVYLPAPLEIEEGFP